MDRRACSDHAAAWDRRARSYERQILRGESHAVVAARDWVCSRAHGETLELGVGAGANLGRYGPDVRLTGVDLSPAMVERARRAAVRHGTPARLLVADAGSLPFDDASFDSLTCTFVLCCVPDVGTALREARRVLRPGGALLLADHVVAPGAGLRTVQRLAEVVSAPLLGERFTRRPLLDVEATDLEVVGSERRQRGLLELVHARVPSGRVDRPA